MKRKSTKEKEVQGTARKDRIRKPKVVSIRGVPKPAYWLADDAKGIYLQICRHLKSVNALQKIDIHIISMAANAIYQYGRMAEVVNRQSRKGRAGGLIQTFSTNARQISPEFTAMEKLGKQVLEYSKILGLDPKAREALLLFVEEPEEEKDPLDEILKGKKTG